MTPDQAIDEAARGELRPVYVLLGEEPWFIRQVLVALKAAVLGGGVPGLNEETLVAGEVEVDRALSAARTLPMMARRRLVVVRDVDRWEAQAAAAERLVEYLKAPSPSTVLVLTAGKLDARRKLTLAARAAGCIVSCDPLGRRELPGWITRQLAKRGHAIAAGVADLIADLVGPELGAVEQTLERLSLHAAPGASIGEEDVMLCVVKLRPGTVWELTDAIARREVGRALGLLADVVADPNDAIRTVGALAGSARKLLRVEAELADGATAEQAATAAGVPPFKARELARQAERLGRRNLERWLAVLARADGQLKGGSRRPARAVLEDAVLSWAAPHSASSQRS